MPSIESLLWPSRFEASTDEATSVRFVANANRYVADVRSNGFAVGSRDEQARVGIRFSGSNAGVVADLSLSAAAMHLITKGSTASVRRFGRATFENVYLGVDLVYRTTRGDLEFDFQVHPGASIEQIRLAAAAGTRLISESDGSVVAVNGEVRYRLHAPEAYQMRGNERVHVSAKMAVRDGAVQFVIGDYDKTKLLTIDPLVATYSTFLGSGTDGGRDSIEAITTDSAGNIYLAGQTGIDLQFPNPIPFPTAPSSLRVPSPRSPQNDCFNGCGFIVKLDANRNVIYGALIPELMASAVAVDPSGSVYATGTTLSSNFPSTAGVFADDPAGRVFVLKLTQDGSALDFAGRFQGIIGAGIALDGNANVYVAGSTDSPALPTTTHSLKPLFQFNGDTINVEGFLVKIDPSGSKLLYGTFLGGIGDDRVFGLSVAANGIATVVGDTASDDFVGLNSPSVGRTDAFIAQVSTDGSSLLAGRRFGGSGNDNAAALSRDSQDGWLVCGSTTSADFPTTAGVVQSRLLGQRNGWVVHFDSRLDTLYSTYLGGGALDGARAVASDRDGNAYMAGVTFSPDLLTTSDGFQNVTAGALGDVLAAAGSEFYIEPRDSVREAYMAVLTPDGKRVSYGTYLGGYIAEPRSNLILAIANAIAVTANGTVYVTGSTTEASFPITDGGFRETIGGQLDAFLVAFQPSSLFITSDFILPGAMVEKSYAIPLQATGGTPPYRWKAVGFRLPDGLQLDEGGTLRGVPLNDQPEIAYQFTAKVTDSAGNVAYKNLHIPIVYPNSTLCANRVCESSVLVNQTISFPPRFPTRSIPPYTLQIVGDLPPGISFDATSVRIGGNPAAAGTYRFTAIVQDSIGKSASLTWEVVVTDSAVVPGSPMQNPMTPPPASPTPAPRKRGGGGGALDIWMLVSLAALVLGTSRRRRMSKSA